LLGAMFGLASGLFLLLAVPRYANYLKPKDKLTEKRE
jgi:hypothetical protein